jgi:hypothetical protein
VVSWTTSMELGTTGFHVHRSSTGQLADAVQVTTLPRPARGNSSTGASYTFVDESASEGPYSYWLEEITRGGSVFYGPVSTDQLANGERFYSWLPSVAR